MTEAELRLRISCYRELLLRLADRHGLGSPQLLKASIRLDRLLNLYSYLDGARRWDPSTPLVIGRGDWR